MACVSKTPLADQLATLDVHQANKDVLHRITKRFDCVTEDGCVLLTGPTNAAGRPRITWYGRRCLVARIIVALRDDLDEHETWRWDTRHTCHNPRCVNPDHLTHGTRQQNADDCVNAGRTRRGEQHGGSKLTAADVQAIRADARSQGVIAQVFGISRSQVGKVQRGEAWSH